MSAPHKLTDPVKVREIITLYKNDPTPTLAGLCRLLGLKSYHTFLNYLNNDDEIADILSEGYKYYVETHEKKLHEKACVGSIFALKCIKSLGFVFHDRDQSSDNQTKTDNKLIIEVISKDAKNTTVQTSA